MAALLNDQIDRLTQRTRSIKATATEIATIDPNTRLFTHAVLYAELGDLIRDIDPSEMGLFQLETQQQVAETTQPAQVKRVEFVGATPLKRAPRRNERPQDQAPEVYVQSALKCLHAYRDVRPMPRAQSQLSGILKRLERTRSSISALQESLQKHQVISEPQPKRSQLKDEEEAIASLQARMSELNERRTKLAAATPLRAPPSRSMHAPKPPPTPASPEDRFWATPAEPSRTLTFAPNNLMDESLLADMSDTSFSMPPPLGGQNRSFALPDRYGPLEPIVPEEDEAPTPKKSRDIPSQRYEEMPPPPPSPPVVESEPEPEVESETALDTSTRTGRIRVTTEVDRIASKLVSVYADVLNLPRSPNAKETIARLQDLATQIPTPESPSQSSLSAVTGISHGPTAQQVLMAYMLYELLAAPKHTLSMRELKDMLVAKTKSNPGLSVSALGQNPTRIVYGCVGKRVLKLPRVGKEQMVAFDI